MADIAKMLDWINEHPEEWEELFNQRVMEVDSPHKYLQDFILCVENEWYEALMVLIGYSSTDMVMVEVLKEYPVAEMLQEVRAHGPKSVFEDFIASYRHELRQYDRRHSGQTTDTSTRD